MGKKERAHSRTPFPACYGVGRLLVEAKIPAMQVSRDDRQWLQNFLEAVHGGDPAKGGWKTSDQGPNASDQPAPNAGFDDAEYPGAAHPFWYDHFDCNVRRHYRWTLLVYSSLHVLVIPLTELTRPANMDVETLQDLLAGVRYGLGISRLKPTWHLLVRLLQHPKFPTVRALVQWLARHGEPVPYHPVPSIYRFDKNLYVVVVSASTPPPPPRARWQEKPQSRPADGAPRGDARGAG